MDKTKVRHFKLAVVFGAFSALVALVVQIGALALLGTAVTGETLISAAASGAGIFVVSGFTVLFLWPRIGFDPFDSHAHDPT